MNLLVIKSLLTAGKALLIKYAPEILVGTGILSMVGGTAIACKATLKVNEVVKESEEVTEKIEAVHNGEAELKEGEEYTEEDYKKDKMLARKNLISKLIKMYGPAVLSIILGIGCILSGCGIFKARIGKVTVALNTLQTAFTQYRKNVVKELGKDMDIHFATGSEMEKKTVENPDGSVEEKVVHKVDPNNLPRFVYMFDELTSTIWSDKPGMNCLMLKQIQQSCQDKLCIDGHLYLNEVLQKCGLPQVKDGWKYGWLYDASAGAPVRVVDFGIYDVLDKTKKLFRVGAEPSVLLEFNVEPIPDGALAELIKGTRYFKYQRQCLPV